MFDRNPRYWKKDAAGIQLPYLDQVILEIVPDQNAELVRLQSGQFDMLQQQVRPEDIATLRPLEQQGKLKLIELGVGADPDSFFFNLRSPYWAKDPRRDWITRKEFRQAISHAIDREAFANTVFLGAGVPIWGPVTPGNKKWFSPNVPRYGYSLERAKEILAGLGLTNRDADEWLEDAKGTEARFTCWPIAATRRSSAARRSCATSSSRSASRVDVVLLEQGALMQRMLKGDFESIMFVFNATNLDPAMNPDFWLSSGSAHVWNIGQPKPATDWEKEIDDLMATVMTQRRSAPSASAPSTDVQMIFAENLPVLYFVAPRLYMGVSTRVGGLDAVDPAAAAAVERRADDGAGRTGRPPDGTLPPQASRLRAAARLRRVVGGAAPDAPRARRLRHHPGPGPHAPTQRAQMRDEPRPRSAARRAVSRRGSAAPCGSTSAARCSIRGRSASLVGERALNTAVLATDRAAARRR